MTDCNHPFGTIAVNNFDRHHMIGFIRNLDAEQPIVVSLDDFQKMYATIPQDGVVTIPTPCQK